MSESESSKNAEAPDSPPNQLEETDWNAIAKQLSQALTNAADKLAGAITDAASQEPKVHWSQKVSSVCTFLALITTIAITIVGGTFLYRQQGLTNIKLSLAHIQVDMNPDSTCLRKMDCLSVFEVTNQGPAIANKITIDVILHTVSDEWKTSINDISKLHITTSPPSVKVSKILMNVNEPSSLNTVARNNEYELDINDLPPGRSVKVDLGSAIPVVPESLSVNTTLFIVSQTFQNFNFGTSFPILKAIQKYLDAVFSIGEFEINTTCDNCDNTDQQMVSASSLENSLLQTSLDPQDQLDSIWTGPLRITYERPRNSKLLQLSNPLNLWTEPQNPNNPLDSLTQNYLGIVTICILTGQIESGSQNACTPSSLSTGS
jgi:hypothetical protein